MANKGIRISNPPGGAASTIFGSSDQADQPRKVHDHQKSSIFGTDQVDGAKRNFLSPRYQQDTKQRLFGENDSQGASPRRVTDTWRSNVVFSQSADCLSDELKRTPRRSPSAGLNPITGELLCSIPRMGENGASPYMNGNGSTTIDEDESPINGEGKTSGNGDIKQNGHQTYRQPPGGKTSGIF